MYFWSYDITYIVLVLPFVFLSLMASQNVKSTFRKYSDQYSRRGLTGAQAAQRVLHDNGIMDVSVQRIAGELTDHYSDSEKVIRLSDHVYDSTSTAAIGVACHEAGHAIQSAKGYFPFKIRSAIIPLTYYGSRLAMPLILLGILFSFSGRFSAMMVNLGIACFALSLILQLVTLPVEFDASRRAMNCIRTSELLTEEEMKGTRKTLSAAALTYVAATALSFAQLARLLLLFRRRNSD